MENTLFGMKIVTNPSIPENEPKIKLSNDIELPEKFRKDFNAWLLERFGTNRVFYVIDSSAKFGFCGSQILIHPNNEQIMRVELQNGLHTK